MYRKFSADNIFDGYRFLQDKVLITDPAGVIAGIVTKNEAGDEIEKLKGILCPGFINAHCHLELSHMKGLIPKQTGLVDFVLKVVNERHLAYRSAGFSEQAGFADDEILAAIETAENEMLQHGIVAVGDICNNELTIPQKKKGRLRYHNFIEASGFPPSVAEHRFKRAADFYKTYSDNFSANSIVPHAPYSVSPEMFGMINDFPDNNLLTIHNQETAAENEFFEKGSGDFLRLYAQMGIDISFFKPPGKPSLQTWLPHFTKGQSIILVHNVVTTQIDIELCNPKPQTPHRALRENAKLFFCLCPNANLYISNTLPDVHMLMRHTDHIVLGTDSLASNNQLSILEEIKTLQNNFTELELAILLRWATINGARALQTEDKLGSFEKGKQPGVILIEGVENLQTNDNTSVKRIL